MKTLKNYDKIFSNLDKMSVEVLWVKDELYKDGIMFTYRYLAYDDATGKYETAFAIENGHGKSHVHLKNKKEEIDVDWKRGLLMFEQMVKEYRKTKYGEESKVR